MLDEFLALIERMNKNRKGEVKLAIDHADFNRRHDLDVMARMWRMYAEACKIPGW